MTCLFIIGLWAVVSVGLALFVGKFIATGRGD